MATAPMIVDLETPGEDLARKSVFVKLHLGLLGNTRKVSSAQVEVDADKNSIHISKSLLDSPELDAIRRLGTCSWQYVSYGVPHQLREVSERMFQHEREKAAERMAEAYTEVRQVLRQAMVELVAHLRDRLTDQPDGTQQRLRESTVQKLREFLETFDFRNVTDDQELKEQVERARHLLSGTTTDAIRNTGELRARVREG